MLGTRRAVARAFGLVVAVGILIPGMLAPPVSATASTAQLRAALLTEANLPQYYRYALGAPPQKWYWCARYDLNNPFTAGREAQFTGRGRYKQQRYVYDDLYAYTSPRVARRWFINQQKVASACTSWSVPSGGRYVGIHEVKSPRLAGAAQVYTMVFTLRSGSWVNHFVRVTVRKGDWTQIVQISDRQQAPPRSRFVEITQLAYQKAVRHLT
jgi:hypothetical protein